MTMKLQSTPLTDAMSAEFQAGKLGKFFQVLLDDERRGVAKNFMVVDTDGTDYTVLFYEKLGEAPRPEIWGPVAIGFLHDKIKFHLLYSNESHRDTKIYETLKERAVALEAKASAKIASKAAPKTPSIPTTPNGCKVGDIYCCSWGYDQTNVDFYEIVATPTAKTIHLRQLCATSQGADNMKVAVPGKYRDTQVLVKRVASSDAFSLSKYKWLTLWDGSPQYETPANMGH